MSSIHFSKKNIFALLLGVLTVFFLGSITTGFAFFIAPHFGNSGTMMIILGSAIALVTLGTPVIGGFVVGWRVQEQAWLYGALFGMLLVMLSMAIVSLTFVLPFSLITSPSFPIEQAHALAKASLLSQFLHAPFFIFVTLLGGMLGGWAYRKRQKIAVNRLQL